VDLAFKITRWFAREFFCLALLAILGLLNACHHSSTAQQPTAIDSKARSDSSVDYQTAIESLRYPEQWCQAAKVLTELGDRQALIPLLQAYETPTETNKVCLLDAMEDLGAQSVAHEMFEQGQASERQRAMYLMELFPDETHLPLIEQAMSDQEPAVRQQARQTLTLQLQTPAWENLLIRLLKTGDLETRTQAIQSLARRHTTSARQALSDRLAEETDPALKQMLDEILHPPS